MTRSTKSGKRLTDDDLTDLALLRLDVMAVITIGDAGVPLNVHVGHIRPGTDGLFVMALIHELIKSQNVDLEFLVRYTNIAGATVVVFFMGFAFLNDLLRLLGL